MCQKQGKIDMIEELRPELTGYCYRMMGSIFEAEDAVQDTMVRAWQNWDQVREHSSRRAWVYRVATNVCLDKLRNAKRRALPMDISEPVSSVTEPREQLPRASWIWPTPDTVGDPLNIVVSRETIRLSFIAILQILPPRQRAVLILHDVFRWSASETANVLGMTTAAVNSALQRARRTITQSNLQSNEWKGGFFEADQQVLARYVEAFEKYDIDALLALFSEGGSLSMPPYTMWVRGNSNLFQFYHLTRSHCLGSRLLPIRANGNSPAYAQYVPNGREGLLTPWAIHILEMSHEKIAHIHHFIDSDLFDRFGLPPYLDANKNFSTNR
ncbi:sigma-70 family RNA polymerase sigma factor [Gracilibacillus massiliensis]|uniref:sigma-70 family RNA polymerase sigma factor n=1 Tax=Gracilibacillus massiliensis TaxID=1564956 RepID=UPI00071D329C|nr:sigma-70 family RNA polymerase sigma factor [Gracilibacillus massiliensis]